MKIINVVSGKGGTGKTLLVAVLAELLSRRSLKFLVIDVDIFVRGLTCLLYYHQDRSTNLLPDEEPSVADVLQGDFDLPITRKMKEVRYRSFNVWPAVRRIDDQLDYHNVTPDDFNTAAHRISLIIDSVRLSSIESSQYDVVFLDSRAGFDELIASTHSVADITLNIQEDDLIASITSENLQSQLKSVPSRTPVYNVTNKSRSAFGLTDGGPRDLGHIPFDADVRANYGRKAFWSAITQSLLEPSLFSFGTNYAEMKI